LPDQRCDRKGDLQKVWGLFGTELDEVMSEMNEELVA
jgi:type I restriction enzyme R subunit